MAERWEGWGPRERLLVKLIGAEASCQPPAGEARGGLLHLGLGMAASPLKVCIVGSGNW